MDTLLSMRVFREVVESGSFVAAAQRLDLSTAMTSKHVAHLERYLGVRLLNRSSRHLSLTDDGRVYLEQCREALDIVGAAEAAMGQAAHQPEGTLRVTAPVWLANPFFAGVLADYQRQYPAVVVEMVLENRMVELVEGGFDLALRATAEPAPTLIARPLCPVPFDLVASPAYLAQHPPLTDVADLANHRLILPTYVDMSHLTLTQGNRVYPLALQAACRSSDSNLSLHLVRAGVGLAFVPAWLTAADVAGGQLVACLTDAPMPAPTLYACYTSRKFMAPRVRTFIDFLVKALATGPGRDSVR